MSETPSPHVPACWYVTSTLDTTAVGVTAHDTVGEQYPYAAVPQAPAPFGWLAPLISSQQYSPGLTSHTMEFVSVDMVHVMVATL